jgi:hypothetical protein
VREEEITRRALIARAVVKASSRRRSSARSCDIVHGVMMLAMLQLRHAEETA